MLLIIGLFVNVLQGIKEMQELHATHQQIHVIQILVEKELYVN